METEVTTPSFEVRCAACNCSFAAGTKQCVHCGAPLGVGLGAPWVRGAAGRADEGDPEASGPWFGKLALYVGTGILAVAANVFRQCSEQ